MDKKRKNYLMIPALLTMVPVLAVFALAFIYRYSSINTYRYILLIIIMATILITLVFLISMASVYHIYERKHASRFLLRFARFGLKVFLPLTAFVTGLFKGDKDSVRRYYVEVNNILAQSGLSRYKPADVMVLLPHCLQNSDCGYKITGGIEKCRRCGRCTIGEIAGLVEETGIKAFVVTGGTAARNAVRREKPRVILSVACERDLMSGIADVEGIPVIGIINERPNGPCFNTVVDVGLFRQKLMQILE